MKNTLRLIYFNRLWAQNSVNNLFFCVCIPIRQIALCLVRMASSTLKDISHLVKFDGNNFHEWKFGCRLLLETHGLLDVIDGVEKIPSEVSHMSGSIRVKVFLTHVFFPWLYRL